MAQLVKRKILQHGNSLTVALPPGWTKFYGLRKGDVIILISNGKITVLPPKCKVKHDE